ncbi:MAG: helix-turn-helix domain-containing protein [Oscillospiraceae bacterium]|nr:helix-turn-helix domain-containing protein [Oscillospiraceae bacterium]
MTFSRLISISRSDGFETLETLCQALECAPNDLFTIDFNQPE